MKPVKLVLMFITLFVISFNTFAKIEQKMMNKKMMQKTILDSEYGDEEVRMEDEAYADTDMQVESKEYKDEVYEEAQIPEGVTEEELAIANNIPEDLERQAINFKY